MRTSPLRLAAILLIMLHWLGIPGAFAAPGANAALLAKTIELTVVTNTGNSLSVQTQTPILPGEAVVPTFVHPDGRVEEALTSSMKMTRNEGSRYSAYFSWTLPASFGTQEVQMAMDQIRQIKIESSTFQKLIDKTLGNAPPTNAPGKFGRLVELTHLRPYPMFTITNKSGGVLSGFLTFERTIPGSNSVATVTLRNPGTPLRNLMAFYKATVPPGYALEATVETSVSANAEAHTGQGRSANRSDYHGSWFLWSFNPEAIQAGVAQLNQLANEGPIQIALGQPRQVFVITNNVGEVARGFFELKGPGGADALKPSEPREFSKPPKNLIANSSVAGSQRSSVTKIIEIQGLTNTAKSLTVHSLSPLSPGENVFASLKHPDGQIVDALTSYSSAFSREGRHRQSTYLSWTFPASFGLEDIQSAVRQIQKIETDDSVLKRLMNKATGTVPPTNVPGNFSRLLELAHQRSFNLFTVTNQAGGVLSGLINFERAEPENPPGAEAAATVSVRDPGFPMKQLMVFYNVSVPRGYSLEATITSTGPSDCDSRTSHGRSSAGNNYSSSWSARSFQKDIIQEGVGQLARLPGQGPFKVVFGQPREVFAITNVGGEVARGFFELKGPAKKEGKGNR